MSNLQWAAQTLSVYSPAKAKFAWLVETIEANEANDEACLETDRIIDFYQGYFLAFVNELVDLYSSFPSMSSTVGTAKFEAQFRGVFAAGPGGLDIILPTTFRLLAFTARASMAVRDGSPRIQRLYFFCQVLLASLQHLRLVTPRDRYDPRAISKFEKTLLKSSLKVCTLFKKLSYY